MAFNSVSFLVFFPLVVLIYYSIPEKTKKYWLLVTSIFFYACCGIQNLLVMIGSILITYVSGLMINAVKDKKVAKKWILSISIGIILSILFFYKYINFALQNLILLHWMKKQQSIPMLNIVLPIGISFYIFQMIAYLADVYLEKVSAENDLLKFCLFISFFPKVTAGPLVKSKDFLKQLNKSHPFDATQVQSGLLMMLLGMFEKIVIADTILIIVSAVWGKYAALNSVYLWIGTFAYAIYIYCDFGGYSHIAIGAAKVLGFQIPDNFIQPYFATSVKEFWRRWHVSLSGWLKEYLYIPLGGNKCGTVRKYINIILVFIFSGLWHGAGCHYILWGILHGIYQIAEEVAPLNYLKRKCSIKIREKRNSHVCTMMLQIKTFVLVSIAWIFFYCPSLTEGLKFVRGMFLQWNIDMQTFGVSQLGIDHIQLCYLLLGGIVLMIIDIFREKGRPLGNWICSTKTVNRWGICLLTCLFIIVVAFRSFGQGAAGFVYFQF